MDGTRMAAVFRADLNLPVGKIAAQVGHAFLSAWLAAHASDPASAEAYMADSQAKIVLLAADLPALNRIAAKTQSRGVACSLIVDAARTVLSEPTATVLGLGPMSRADYNAITRGLALL